MTKNWDTKIIFILLIVLIVLAIFIRLSRRYSQLNTVETFTPKIHSMYRPYVRHINHHYESFMNNYGPDVIINKFKKWGIY